MAIEKYYRGETFRQKAHITDVDDADTDPDSIEITIEDSAGIKQVTDSAMSKDAVGLYHHDYDIPADAALGQWITEVTADKTQKAREHDAFIVMEAL
jgi:uncharacterized protein YfaS (alpha-2-macroglobulin family)